MIFSHGFESSQYQVLGMCSEKRQNWLRKYYFLSTNWSRKLLTDALYAVIYAEIMIKIIGLRQANLVLIAYASSEGSGEPAHPRSLARTAAARLYKQ